MDKIKENKVAVVVLAAVVLGAFYWIQIRPVQIKKKCAWFTEIIKADPGVTKEQAELNKIKYEQCKTENPGKIFEFDSFKCWLFKNDSVERQPQPERTEVREATKNQYNTCLRKNGL